MKYLWTCILLMGTCNAIGQNLLFRISHFEQQQELIPLYTDSMRVWEGNLIQFYRSMPLKPGIPMADFTIETRDTSGKLISTSDSQSELFTGGILFQEQYSPIGNQHHQNTRSWSFSTLDIRHPDSILTEQQNGQQWEPSYKYIYRYDTRGNQQLQHLLKWNKDTHSWTTESLCFFEYDHKGRLITQSDLHQITKIVFEDDTLGNETSHTVSRRYSETGEVLKDSMVTRNGVISLFNWEVENQRWKPCAREITLFPGQIIPEPELKRLKMDTFPRQYLHYLNPGDQWYTNEPEEEYWYDLSFGIAGSARQGTRYTTLGDGRIYGVYTKSILEFRPGSFTDTIWNQVARAEAWFHKKEEVEKHTLPKSPACGLANPVTSGSALHFPTDSNSDNIEWRVYQPDGKIISPRAVLPAGVYIVAGFQDARPHCIQKIIVQE